MRRALIAGLTSFGATYLTAPVVRSALVRRGSIDVPNYRSSHSAPVPRGGGIACLAGVALGAVATGRQSGVSGKVALATAILAALGLADDQMGHLHHNVRLIGQAVAGATLAPSASAVPPVAAGTIGVVNVVNFMDGINGITGSTAAIWGLAALAAGCEVQDPALQTIGAVTAGAGLGFLPHNAPVAHIFLGDVGSYLFGGLMSAGIAGCWTRPALMLRVAAPLLPYGADAAYTIVRRARTGAVLTKAHREHVYQRVVREHGLSHVQMSALHALAASLVALASRSRRPWVALLGTASVVGGYLSIPAVVSQLPRTRTSAAAPQG